MIELSHILPILCTMYFGHRNEAITDSAVNSKIPLICHSEQIRELTNGGSSLAI